MIWRLFDVSLECHSACVGSVYENRDLRNVAAIHQALGSLGYGAFILTTDTDEFGLKDTLLSMCCYDGKAHKVQGWNFDRINGMACNGLPTAFDAGIDSYLSWWSICKPFVLGGRRWAHGLFLSPSSRGFRRLRGLVGRQCGRIVIRQCLVLCYLRILRLYLKQGESGGLAILANLYFGMLSEPAPNLVQEFSVDQVRSMKTT